MTDHPKQCALCRALVAKRCRTCRQWKPRTEYHRNATKQDLLATTCATCTATVNDRQRLRRGQQSPPKPRKRAPLIYREQPTLSAPPPSSPTE